MMSYAASMAEAAQSPLTPLFRQQLLAEGGFMTKVNDLHFLEEGGVIATIHGETVAMGSAYFMRSQKVSLPHDLKLQTGVFLAVDGVLCAIFVIKYRPSRNAEWALRALRRNHIRPVLAVRSSNVTPGLIKRKFGVDCRCVYPTVSPWMVAMTPPSSKKWRSLTFVINPPSASSCWRNRGVKGLCAASAIEVA